MRELFDVPQEITYFNCAAFTPQPKAVTAAGYRAVDIKAAPWQIGYEEWTGRPERLRSLVAQLLQTEADPIAIVPSASYGLSTAAANLPLEAGQSILILDEQFPSNVYAWRALAQERSAEMIVLDEPSQRNWTQTILDAIDSHTGIVALPPCHWTDGSLIDLVAVSQKARSVGASLVIDASQTIGAYPFDLEAIQPDFMAFVGYKWLLGSYGLSYLYMAPKWRTAGRPIEYSNKQRTPTDDSQRVNYSDTFQPNARRYDMGECSQFVLTPIAIAGVEQVLSWGVETVQQRLRFLTDMIEEGATQLGYDAPPKRVDHILGLRRDGVIPAGLIDFLAERNAYVAHRGKSMRVAPYMHNNEADVERFIGLLKEFDAR